MKKYKKIFFYPYKKNWEYEVQPLIADYLLINTHTSIGSIFTSSGFIF